MPCSTCSWVLGMAWAVLRQLLLLQSARAVPCPQGTPHIRGVGCVWMHSPELELLFHYLRKARTFFEFGTGASTVHIANKSRHLDTMVSVDVDRRWVHKVRSHTWLRNRSARKPQSIRLLRVHIGRLSGYGFPLQNKSRCKHRARVCQRDETHPACGRKTRCYKDLIGQRSWWPAFSQIVVDEAARYKIGWDVVLVDSRFRAACALKSLLLTRPEDISSSVVMVHDYSVRRPYYGVIERFAHLETMAETLAVFRKKHNVNAIALQHAIQAFEYDPI